MVVVFLRRSIKCSKSPKTHSLTRCEVAYKGGLGWPSEHLTPDTLVQSSKVCTKAYVCSVVGASMSDEWSVTVFACWSNELARRKCVYQSQHLSDIHKDILHQAHSHCRDNNICSLHRLVPRYYPGWLPHLHASFRTVDKRARGALRQHCGSIYIIGCSRRRT